MAVPRTAVLGELLTAHELGAIVSTDDLELQRHAAKLRP